MFLRPPPVEEVTRKINDPEKPFSVRDESIIEDIIVEPLEVFEK